MRTDASSEEDKALADAPLERYVSVPFSVEEFQRLRLMAAFAGVPMSRLVRESILERLDAWDGTPPAESARPAYKSRSTANGAARSDT